MITCRYHYCNQTSSLRVLSPDDFLFAQSDIRVRSLTNRISYILLSKKIHNLLEKGETVVLIWKGRGRISNGKWATKEI